MNPDELAEKAAQLAYFVVIETLAHGAKTHDAGAWENEPIGMHLLKSGRHSNTAQQLIEHPDFCRDSEDAETHIRQAICRAVMALWRMK